MLKKKINVCKRFYIEKNSTVLRNILTLQATSSFARVVAHDEFVHVVNILIHIIACFIVTVLLIHTGGEENNQAVKSGNVISH